MTQTREKSKKPGFLGDLASHEIKSVVNEYRELHDADLTHRKESYQKLVNHYYDLATDFYEFGWGQSFHFAPGRRGESFKDALLRHELFLGGKLELKSGMQVLDAGCGVGGPMRNLARHTGASITGINNNAYQIERARKHTREVSSLCRLIHGNYMQIPETDNHFDAAYEIEAMPHAPDRTAAYREVLRVLRPGGCFAGYGWCLTEHFDPQNADHLRIKKDIEVGNGMPDTPTTAEVDAALRAAGFELLEGRDLASEADPEMPWYRPLQGDFFSLASLPRTPTGRALTNLTLRVGEWLRLVPRGARDTSTILNQGADALVAGGKADIFTPMYFYLVRKPNAEKSA